MSATEAAIRVFRTKRASARLGVRGCRPGPGTDLPANRLSEGDPRGSGIGVHLVRSRSMGVSARRGAELLPAREADGQCVHRILQWQVQGGMPERTLVHEP